MIKLTFDQNSLKGLSNTAFRKLCLTVNIRGYWNHIIENEWIRRVKSGKFGP